MRAAVPSSPAAPGPVGAVPFERRPWGGFETLTEGPGFKVKRLVVEPGQRLSLQRHRQRAESWIVVTGSPRVIVSGRVRRIRPREAVAVPKGAWHRIENPGKVPVIIVEVQHGPYLGEDDIIRRQDDYGRTNGGPSPSGRGAIAVPRRPGRKRSGSDAPTPRRGRRAAE